MSMKTIMRGLVVACCAALGLNAWAKTIAYWDGDITEGSSKGGWTLSAGLGATINADGTVTTEKKDGGPQNLGLILSRTDDYTSNALTLVFKYSGLDVCAHNVSMAEMVWGNGETMNKHVARIGSSASNCGMSNGSSQLNAANYTIPTAGMMAISMSNSDGMRISFQAEGATSFTDAAWYTGSDVKLGTKFGSMKIGGCDYASTSYHRPGMKIEAVAIVDEVFESGSVYVFPDAPATYAKSSLSAYINETTAQTLIPNATLADLLNGTVKGKINGGYISSDFKDDVITASYVTRVPADGDIEKVTLQFKVREGNTMSKAVLAECVQDGADVKIKATGAKHTTSARTYGNDATTWAGGGTVVTSASAGGYGVHEITFNVPYDTVKTISESTTWANAGIAAPEAGKKTIVFVHGGATVTFADDTIPAGIVLASKMENDGIAVAGTIPMLTTDEALTILADTTATIKPGYRGKVVVKGTAQFTGANSTDYHPEIALAGGTLKVVGSNTGSGSMQFYKMSLSADSTIDAAVNFYSIASQYGRFNFGLNGHTLTKKGTGTYYVYTPTLVGGGAIDVQDGTLTLKDAKLETGATLTMSVAAGKTLKFEGSTTELKGTLKLLQGSFQAPVDTLTVEVPEGYELTKTTASSMTTYTATRTEPTTITMKDWTGTAFTYVDGETTRDTTLIDGDKIVIPSTIADDDYWQWHFTDGTDAFAGHEVEINKNMNWKWSVGTMTIGNGATAHLFNTYGLNDGASVSGKGTLSLNDNGANTPVKGAATVSCTVAFVGNGSFALTTAASTLTCAKFEEGEEIPKVVSGVEGKHAEYSDGKYVLVNDISPLKPGENIQKDTEPTTEELAKYAPVPVNAEAEAAGQAAILKVVSKKINDTQWVITVDLDETKMPEGKKIDDSALAFAIAGLDAIAGSATAQQISVPAGKVTPGAYYSVIYGDSPTTLASEGMRALATSAGVTITVPAMTGKKVQFFRVKASANPTAN